MTQRSRMWDGTTIGDAVEAAYDSDEWDDIFSDVFNSDLNRGVLPERYDELVGDVPGLNTFRIGTGSALVKGKWYNNDAAVSFVLAAATPGNWRRDRIVLSSTWADINDATRDPAVQTAQTIRLIRLINPAENVAPPAVTQSDGVLWEIPLYTVEIDAAGTVTIYEDEREFATALQGPKRLFVPALGGWNNTGGTSIVADDYRGVALADAAFCGAYGHFIMPHDLGSVGDILAIYPIIIPTASGNAYLRLIVSGGACAEAYATHTLTVAFAAYAVTISLNNCVMGPGVADLTWGEVGDIILIDFVRDGTDPLDTINNVVYCPGFIIEYVAKR